MGCLFHCSSLYCDEGAFARHRSYTFFKKAEGYKMELIRCSFCGAFLPEHSRFCGYCGNVINDTNAPTVNTPVPPGNPFVAQPDYSSNPVNEMPPAGYSTNLPNGTF